MAPSSVCHMGELITINPPVSQQEELLQQKEPTLYLPVILDSSKEESWPCSYLWTNSLRRKESLYYSPVSTATVASVVRSSGLGPT
ncbi:hypothetical protein EOD39_11556 [Acipenser ruthenus]|uniref:Uncharacterized protein n=1 Tax=Acipenser ruthenus TaxID=7906 RepID=A0A662YS53_ACIRT|nr:hypothetical protein EOD39_11556 [Acipenser ruthenus]